MRYTPLWAALLFLAPSLPAQTPAPRTLSLDQALTLALDNSLNLQKGFLDLQTSKTAADNLWAEFLPGISAGAGLNYQSAFFTGEGLSAGPNSGSYSFSLGLSLSLNPGLASAMKILTLAYQAQLLSYESSRLQLAIQVSKTFHSLLAEQRNLAHLREIGDLADKQMEKNRIAFGNGIAGELTLLRSRLSAETAKLNIRRAEAACAAKLGDFLVLLGFEQHTPAVLEGQVEIFPIRADPEALIRDYLAQRPDIQNQRRNIERLEAVKDRAVMTARAPSVSLSAQWRGSGSAAFSDSLSAGISLSIPIDSWIPGGKQHQALKAAEADIEKARLDLQNAEAGAMAEIRSLTANLQSGWQTVEISRLRVQIAERTYELTEQGFQQGTVEFLALEDTRNSMAEARQQLLTDELAYKTTSLDLAAALNLRPEELEQVTGADR